MIKKKIICFLLGHKWGGWKLFMSSIKYKYPYPCEIRKCKRCNKNQFRPYV